jgi:hypothetical protein
MLEQAHCLHNPLYFRVVVDRHFAHEPMLETKREHKGECSQTARGRERGPERTGDREIERERERERERRGRTQRRTWSMLRSAGPVILFLLKVPRKCPRFSVPSHTPTSPTVHFSGETRSIRVVESFVSRPPLASRCAVQTPPLFPKIRPRSWPGIMK